VVVSDATRPDVLYITIDSLRADSVGYLGGADGTTPVLNELAADGLCIDRAVANGIPTYYSFKSLLGGIHALSHRQEIGLPETTTALAEVFADAGYQTAGINARNPWLTPAYGYDRGFQYYWDFMGGGESRNGLGSLTRTAKRIAKCAVGFSDTLTDVLGRSARTVNAISGLQPLEPAESVTETAIEWLDVASDNPVFLWVHYMDPHYPWVPPAEYLDDVDVSRFEVGTIWHRVAADYQSDSTTINNETLATIRNLYEAEVRRTDAAIGRLLNAFHDRNCADGSLVAVAGDHGTELAEHGGFSHGPRTLYNEVVAVPLLFCGSGVVPDSRELGALVDVPATLLGAVDGLAKPDAFEGIDLQAERRTGVSTEVVYDIDPARNENEGNGLLQARTEPPWKLIRNQHTGTSELYHLDDDPSEQEPIEGEPTVRKRLARALDDHRDRIVRRNRTVEERRRVRHRVAELREADKL
jgi:arylsulfatase A-like enzyme